MCGIVGRLAAASTSEDHLKQAIRAVAHRGPDGHGNYQSAWAQLGHTRLAILDLDARSNQPFASPDGRWQLVYNGEVYNYRELREELERSSAWRFRTNSDTEVVLASLITWGPRAVSRFNGMWALCLADTTTREALLSRDRFGVKPLFYHHAGDGSLTFASRVTALKTLAQLNAAPNLRRLQGFLQHGVSDWGSETFHDGIVELTPGSNLHFTSDRALTIDTYFSIEQAPSRVEVSVDEVANLLEDAVALRLRSDVPIALTLSGGLDSSVLAAYCARSGSDVLAVTARIKGHKDDESFAAERLCRALGIPWMAVDIDVTRILPEQLVLATRHLDGPTQSPAFIAADTIMQRLRSVNRPVVLEGQGGDETFGGYAVHLAPYVFGDLLRQWKLRDAVEVYRSVSRHLNPGELTRATARSLLPAIHTMYLTKLGARRAYGPVLDQLTCDDGEPTRRHSMTALQALAQERGPGLRSLLNYGDRMSMAHGIEAREPYLDYRLFALMANCAPATLLQGGQGKFHLRAIAERILPIPDPLFAPKGGDLMPTRQWMMHKDSEEALLNGMGVDSKLFNRSGLMALLDQNRSKDIQPLSLCLFRFLMAEYWLRSL